MTTLLDENFLAAPEFPIGDDLNLAVSRLDNDFSPYLFLTYPLTCKSRHTATPYLFCLSFLSELGHFHK
jgi:hypothetical protein